MCLRSTLTSFYSFRNQLYKKKILIYIIGIICYVYIELQIYETSLARICDEYHNTAKMYYQQ